MVFLLQGGAQASAAAPGGEEELVSSVVCGWSMTGGAIMPSITLMVLPFDVAPFRMTVCFLGTISAVEEAF